jgi:hypothetical protein
MLRPFDVIETEGVVTIPEIRPPVLARIEKLDTLETVMLLAKTRKQ